MSISNEHVDMSGNPMDAPFECDNCGREVKEHRIFGTRQDESLIFCSQTCKFEWEDAEFDKLRSEVERLREALRRIIGELTPGYSSEEMNVMQVAREALGEES